MYSTCFPVIEKIASSVSRISFLASSSDTLAISTWLYVWFPIRCPSSNSRFTSSGFSLAFFPIRKKVAFTFLSFSPSKSLPVQWTLGPSSNVMAIFGASATIVELTYSTASVTALSSAASFAGLFSFCPVCMDIPSRLNRQKVYSSPHNIFILCLLILSIRHYL